MGHGPPLEGYLFPMAYLWKDIKAILYKRERKGFAGGRGNRIKPIPNPKLRSGACIEGRIRNKGHFALPVLPILHPFYNYLTCIYISTTTLWEG
jgi:hypothetical protein